MPCKRGKRVIAVDPDHLPDAYEEPIVAGLPARDEWVWLVHRSSMATSALDQGRNMTAGDLAKTIEIEHWTPEQAASEYSLPLQAVVEAQRYAEAERDLIAAEEAENRIISQRYELPRATLS